MPNYSGIWTEQAMMQAVAAGTWSSVPGAPTIGTATATGATSASVAFTAPAFAGLPAVITSYTVTSSPGGITASGASSPVAITGLTEGTPYTFTVTATNASGTGTASAASNSVTPVQINYIEDTFSTWLYTGNGSTQTITNGIDLAGKGGMVWSKTRNSVTPPTIVDTVRGRNSYLKTNTTDAAVASNGPTYDLVSFNNNGYTLGPNWEMYANNNGSLECGWTFREQPKFFDVVTWTGNSTARSIAHNLGSTPGCIFVKVTNLGGENWVVWHRSINQDSKTQLFLNTTDAAVVGGKLLWGASGTNANMTSTTFSVGTATETNETGNTYVAYLFAHDAGGFGLTGTDNVISCGSFTTNSSGVATVNLGYEPQWVMTKVTNTTGSWGIKDNIRGMVVDPTPNETPDLYADVSDAESQSAGVQVTSTGFRTGLAGSRPYIYIAIRRGPMKVPTTGTSVFAPIAATASTNTSRAVGFPADMTLSTIRTISDQRLMVDRLRGYANTNSATPPTLDTTSTAAEVVNTSATVYNVWNTTALDGPYSNSFSTIWWHFRRAPGFFDEVCYTGTGSARTVTHNLTVVPELMIVKRRDTTGNWNVYSAALGATKYILLNSDYYEVTATSVWNDTAPTSSVFTVGTFGGVNASGGTYVSYLFASVAGVSKVGSYTGTGTTQTINCGFTSGSRFVLIKRTDYDGDWYVWDSARGIVAGNDPYILLNSTAAEVTNTDYVDTAATGFEISSTAPAAINASGGTFIFLAIA